MRKTVLASVLSAIVPILAAYSVCAADSHQEANKKIVLEFYEQAINRKDFESASKYLGPRYIQHNQRASDGPDGLKGFIQYLREKYPNAHSEIAAPTVARLERPQHPHAECAECDRDGEPAALAERIFPNQSAELRRFSQDLLS